MDIGDFVRRMSYQSDVSDAPSEVERLEQKIGVRLPEDYRAFLLTCGGGHLNADAPCDGLTPIGPTCSVTRLHSADEVIDLLDSALMPRNLIAISVGHNSQLGCLSIAGLDHGEVFAFDTEMRFFWDEEVLADLPHLDPSIREFFRRRDAGELPERPWGYDNCYRMAGSFAEFLSRLRPEEE